MVQTSGGGTVSFLHCEVPQLKMVDRVLYDTHNHRWRTLQVIMMGIAGQYSGNGLAYFNTVVYANLGVSAVSDQLAYNVGSSIVSATGAVCGGFLTDKMPRRLVLVYGTFCGSIKVGYRQC